MQKISLTTYVWDFSLSVSLEGQVALTGEALAAPNNLLTVYNVQCIL